MRYQELMTVIEHCAGGDWAAVEEAVYPELLQALTPGTAPFQYLSDRKRQLMARDALTEPQASWVLAHDPCYGVYVNLASSDRFNFNALHSYLDKVLEPID